MKTSRKRKRNYSSQECGDIPMDAVVNSFSPDQRDKINQFIRDRGEDDPPVVFVWKNIHNFVRDIPQVVGQPLPDWLHGNGNPTVEDFKDAILSYLHIPEAAPPYERGILPCTVAQSSLVSGKLGWLEANPWMIAVAQVNPAESTPLAAVLVPQPRSNLMSHSYKSPPDGLFQLWG